MSAALWQSTLLLLDEAASPETEIVARSLVVGGSGELGITKVLQIAIAVCDSNRES